jgi:hypothetical protein
LEGLNIHTHQLLLLHRDEEDLAVSYLMPAAAAAPAVEEEMNRYCKAVSTEVEPEIADNNINYFRS